MRIAKTQPGGSGAAEARGCKAAQPTMRSRRGGGRALPRLQHGVRFARGVVDSHSRFGVPHGPEVVPGVRKTKALRWALTCICVVAGDM